MIQDHSYPLPDYSQPDARSQPSDRHTLPHYYSPTEERAMQQWSHYPTSSSYSAPPTQNPVPLYQHDLQQQTYAPPPYAPPSQNVVRTSSQDSAARLSPLPLPDMQPPFDFTLTETTLSPATSNSADFTSPSPASVYYTPLPSLADLPQTPSINTHSSSLGQHLVLSSFGSPYLQPSHNMASSPSLPNMYRGLASPYSPVMASPASFYTPLSSPVRTSSVNLYDTNQVASPAVSSLPLEQLSLSQRVVQPAPRRPPSRRRVSVKQTIRMSSQYRSKEAFQMNGVPGVPVSAILDDTVVPDGADERVLERTGVRQIRLCIGVKGYPDANGKYVSVQKEGEFITRAELAKRLCLEISKYMEKYAKKKPSPDARLKITSKERKLQVNQISTSNLFLLSVGQGHSNIWVVELEALI